MDINDFKKIKIGYMKERDSDAVTALNVLINKLMLEGIEKKAQGAEMGDADVTKIISKTINELKEEKESFEKAGRTDSVKSLERQIQVIEQYMPKLMNEDEIKEVIMSLEDKSVPSVMRHFKANYNGKVDMKLVGEVLKKI